MNQRRAALLVFYDDKNRVLLQDRSDTSKVGERWGFFGGGIEYEESEEQAVKREALEELGIHLRDAKFLGRIKREIPNKNLTVEATLYAAPFAGQEFQQTEGRGRNWFTLKQARELKMVETLDAALLDLIEKFFEEKSKKARKSG